MVIASTVNLVDALRQFHILDPAHLDALSSDLLPRFAEPRSLAKEQMATATALSISCD